MEISMNMRTCPNCGNGYNADITPNCPHCAGNGVGNGAFVATVPPVGGGVVPRIGSFPKTTPPGVMSSGVPSNAINMDLSFVSNQPAVALPTEGEIDPVVGWLVCIDGPMRGADFRIHDGYNYIGREIGDICIRGDGQISRERDSMLFFDSDDNSFTFGPHCGKNAVRVNGAKVKSSSVEVKAFDVLTVGTTNMLLVPLCGSQFNWSEGVNDD